MDFLTPDNLEAFAKTAWEAVTQKNWFLLASLILVALVWGSKKLLAPKVPALNTKEGTAGLAVLLAFAGGLLNAATGGGAFGWALVLTCFKVAMSAGGWALLKELADKYLFKPKGDAAALEASAAKAGEAAAAALPKPTLLKATDIVNGDK